MLLKKHVIKHFLQKPVKYHGLFCGNLLFLAPNKLNNDES
jgi:hypothetical protein